MDSSDIVAAENERFQKFKLGKKSAHAHARSHSRNDSISSLKSLTTGNDFSHFPLPLTNHNGATKPIRPLSLPPLVLPGNANNQNSGVFSTASTAVTNSVPSSKRHSHHRRRSSVSTRHESAELMGMSVPNLPPASPEDNFNLGEKDSIRRRALWALEGKPDVAFNKVEIPDFSTTNMEKIMSSKSSLTPSNSSSYGSGLNMNNKRDSFKLLAGSSSSKDQLQTLVEEEEEEEEEEDDLQCLQPKVENSLPSPASSIKENIVSSSFTPTPPLAVTQQPFPKPRPAALNLRPLSLTPGNLMTAPSNSPSPSLRPGLRALSLTPNPGLDDSTDSLKQLRRGSQIVTPAPPKRPVLNLALGQVTDSPADVEEGKVSDRRSSISYKHSSNGAILNGTGLATPEMTPTFGRRFSTSGSSLSISSSAGISEEDIIFSPLTHTQSRHLSTSEQHFLFKSHHALLARITDLEKALSVRMRDPASSYSRGPSISSTVSGMSDSENRAVTGTMEGPSDEMLRLIADLKSERDELKRDVDGWRQRVNNLESQTIVLVRRVESERREAWAARSKAGLLDVEKGVLAKKLEAVDELIKSHEKDKEIWEKEKETFEKEVKGYKEWVDELENELMVMKKELDCEKAKAFHDPLATPTPNKTFENAFVRPVVIISPPEATGKSRTHGLGFISGDSESSTDVELDSSDDPGFDLNAVEEELDEGYDDEENELAGYEDEDDEDDMTHVSSSSFDSVELSHPTRRQLVGFPNSSSTPTTGTYKALPPASMPYHSLPSHFYRSSLSMNWTFPKGPATTASVVKGNEEEGADRFFDCLDDNDSDSGDSIPSSFSYEKSKGLFARGFVLSPEDDAAFFLPSGVGVTIPIPEEPVKQRTRLEAVTEEEEEEEEEEQSDFEDDGAMFGDIGGIKITFTPPQEENEAEKEEKEQIQVSPSKPKRTSPPPILPALNFGDGTEDDPFSFGHQLVEERTLASAKRSSMVSSPILPPAPVPVVMPVSPLVPVIVSSSPISVSVSTVSSTSTSSSLPRTTSHSTSISMIPRVVSPPTSSRVTSPVPAASTRRPSSTRIPRPPTPSDKPSIPQPLTRSTPTPPPKPKVAPTSTFIRQPSVRRSSPAHKAENTTAGGPPNVPLDERTLNRSTNSECHPFTSFFNSFVHSNQSAVGSKMNTKFVPDDQQHTRLQNLPLHNDSQSFPHTISSVMSSSSPTTRLSFQTLTNLVPWPSRNRSPIPIPTSTSTPSSLPPTPASPSCATLTKLDPPCERHFVSREKQLRRLQSKMQMENVMGMKSCVRCKKCSGEVTVI